MRGCAVGRRAQRSFVRCKKIPSPLDKGPQNRDHNLARARDRSAQASRALAGRNSHSLSVILRCAGQALKEVRTSNGASSSAFDATTEGRSDARSPEDATSVAGLWRRLRIGLGERQAQRARDARSLRGWVAFGDGSSASLGAVSGDLVGGEAMQDGLLEDHRWLDCDCITPSHAIRVSTFEDCLEISYTLVPHQPLYKRLWHALLYVLSDRPTVVEGAILSGQSLDTLVRYAQAAREYRGD